MATAIVSCDGQFIACKEFPETNLQIWNIKTGQNKVYSDPAVTCFNWSPCGTKLAIGNSKGDLKILNLTSEDKLQEFNNLSSDKITSLCFVDNEIVASVDSKSNMTITHIEKNIARLNFHSSEVFSKLNSPIKQISHVAHPNQTSTASNLVYLISETSLAVFNYQTAAISKKMHSLVSVQDPEDISFSTIGTEIIVKCDKLTLLGYSASKKQKFLPSVSSGIALLSKKRFQTKISNFSQTSDGLTICTEADGTCHVIKFGAKSKRTKTDQMAEVEELVKLRIKVKTTSKKQMKVSSDIKYAGFCEVNNSLVVAYGEWSSPSFEIFDIKELIARASQSSKNTVVLERMENVRSKGVNKSTKEQQISATIQSGKMAEFDDIDTRKRKGTGTDVNDKIVTVGDTLEERMEESCKINSAAETDDMDGTAVDAMDKSLTLVQALQSNDMATINEVLSESVQTPDIISTTVKNLAKSFLGDVLKMLESKIKSSPQEANIALIWLKALLRNHPSYILANTAKTYKPMLRIHELSLQRRRYSDCLSRLQGRLSFFLKEDASMTNNQDLMNNLQLRASIGEGAVTHHDLKPQFVYEADNDEETRIDHSDEEDDSEMDDEDDDELMDDLEEEVEIGDEEVEEDVVQSQKRRKTKEKQAADLLGTPDSSDAEEEGFFPET